jgi:hypothetical protein
MPRMIVGPDEVRRIAANWRIRSSAFCWRLSFQRLPRVARLVRGRTRPGGLRPTSPRRADRLHSYRCGDIPNCRSQLCANAHRQLGKVDSTRDAVRAASLHGFNIIGVDGRPFASFSFETLVEAEAAHKAMQAIVAKAKLITPRAGRRSLPSPDPVDSGAPRRFHLSTSAGPRHLRVAASR